MRLLNLEHWRGAAIGAAAAFACGVALAVIANAFLVAGVRGASFSLPVAIGVLVYGSLGVSSSGGISMPAESVLGVSGANVHYSLSVTILGGFVIMIAALVFAGWLTSRCGRAEDRGSARLAAKAALLFAVVMFGCSFFVSYGGMSPEHVEAFIFPLCFALLAAPVGSRLERDGRGFWRVPVEAVRARYGEVVQALGSGFDAVVCALKLTAVGTVLGLVALAINYPHAAGKVLGGRQLIAEILLLPLYFPHLIGAMFLAAQGVAFRVGATGTLQTLGSIAGDHTSVSVSIFGGGQHVPAYFLAALLIPVATGLWGGHLTASRRAGSVEDRLRAALIASTPFVVLSWVISVLIGVTVQGGISGLSGGFAFGTVAVGAIFWPLLWGPVMFLLGAAIQLWSAGDLAAIAEALAVRTAAATPVPAPSAGGGPSVAPPVAGPDAGAVANQISGLAPDVRFCSYCGSGCRAEQRFCNSCGQALE